tara:strand:+ start:144 stop:464 length:321 start_codon:yes stop_codon:yes gene_type:complete
MTSTGSLPPAGTPSAETDQILGFTLTSESETTLLNIDRQHRPARRQQTITVCDAATIGPFTEFTTASLGLNQCSPLLTHPQNPRQGETGCRVKHRICGIGIDLNPL